MAAGVGERRSVETEREKEGKFWVEWYKEENVEKRRKR